MKKYGTGGASTKTGKVLEDDFDRVMQALGFQHLDREAFRQAAKEGQIKAYTRQYHNFCDSIYPNKKGFEKVRPDGVLCMPASGWRGKMLAAELKKQDGPGSTRDKIPKTVLNIQKYPCPAVLVLEGKPLQNGPRAWAEQQVDDEHLIGVFALEEFVRWLDQQLPADDGSRLQKAEAILSARSADLVLDRSSVEDEIFAAQPEYLISAGDVPFSTLKRE